MPEKQDAVRGGLQGTRGLPRAQTSYMTCRDPLQWQDQSTDHTKLGNLAVSVGHLTQELTGVHEVATL